MEIIRTERNSVRIYEPDLDHHLFVEILVAPDDGRNTYRRLWVKPITYWQDAVDLALGMADFMSAPIFVKAIGCSEFLRFYDKRIRSALAGMTDQQSSEMREVAISSMCEMMRDCDDWETRAECFDVLCRLDVVQHGN